jgi:hypothetical protein
MESTLFCFFFRLSSHPKKKEKDITPGLRPNKQLISINHISHDYCQLLFKQLTLFPQIPIAVQFAWAAILSTGMVRFFFFFFSERLDELNIISI